MKRFVLMALAIVPIASVAFAAQSALSIAQIGQKGVTVHQLAGSGADSKGS
ncbi:MAG: hypothetical protein HY923_10185 [Elusimicrobia bacterium]|nr:hypothetical protein [Elusimicrobiota bacterium]